MFHDPDFIATNVDARLHALYPVKTRVQFRSLKNGHKLYTNYYKLALITVYIDASLFEEKVEVGGNLSREQVLG